VWWKQSNKPAEPPRYVLTTVTRGSLITSVKGSGQVSGQNQLELKPLASGAITKILVQSGQEVKANDPLFQVDTKTALKTIRDANQSVADARISLASAELSYTKLKQPPDTVSVTQAQNTLNQAKRDLQKLQEGPDQYDVAQAETELASLEQNIRISSDGKTPNLIRDAYDSAVPVIKTIAQTLQQSLYDADAIIGVDNVSANDAYERQLSIVDPSKLMQASSLYPALKRSVEAFKQEADGLSATNEDPTKIDAILVRAQANTNLMTPFLQAVYDVLAATVASPTLSQSTLNSLQSTIQSDRTSVSGKLTTITTQIHDLANAKTSFTTAQLNVRKAQASLDKLKAGSDPKDIASVQDKVTAAEQALAKLQKGADAVDLALSQNTVQQHRAALNEAQHKLTDAQQTLNDYTVRAPFDGVVANITIHVSDQASASTALATLVTPTKLAYLYF
jgi:multidrug resistance efflux pump